MRTAGLFALAVLALLPGCARCGKAPQEPPALLRRSTDLRTAVMTAWPEFRYTRLKGGGLVLRRTWQGDEAGFEQATRAAFGLHAFQEEPTQRARTLRATRDLFTLEAEWQRGRAETRLRLPLEEGDAQKLLSAPVALTTDQLQLFFPVPPGMHPVAERFEVSIDYEAEDFRTAYLVWQLVDLYTRSTWTASGLPPDFEVARRPDGGPGAIPDVVSFVLTEKNSQARLAVTRDRTRVKLEYQLDTLAPDTGAAAKP